MHADLVRRRMGVGVDDLALAEPRSARRRRRRCSRPAWRRRRRGPARATRRRRAPRRAPSPAPSSRSAWNASLFETGSVSQPTATIVPRVALDPVADEALGGGAAGALGDLRHPLLAQERAGRLEVAAGLLERALASIIGAPVASRSSFTWDAEMVVLTRSPPRSSRPPGPRRSRARAPRASPRRPAPPASPPRRAPRLPSARPRPSARRAAPFPLPLPAISFGVTLLWPAAMPSAIAFTIRLHERIASSLPGMM